MNILKQNTQLYYTHKGHSHEVLVEPGKGEICDDDKGKEGGGSGQEAAVPLLITVDGTAHPVYAEVLGSGFVQFMLKDKVYRCVVAQEEDERLIFLEGDVFKFTKEHESGKKDEKKVEAPALTEGDPTAPMPGKIIKVLVEGGQSVEKDAPVVILEAMKMEHKVVAPYKGIINKVLFNEGDQVALGDVLVEIERVENGD